MNLNNRNVTPEQAQQILAENGTVVSLEEADRMLKIICNFAGIAAQQIERELEATKLKKKQK